MRGTGTAMAGMCVLALAAMAAPGVAADLPSGHPPLPARSTQQHAPSRLVDLNSASIAELKTLPGIGDAEAARIVAARPYPSKAKLVASKALSEAQFAKLKGLVEARQKLPAAGKPIAKQ